MNTKLLPVIIIVIVGALGLWYVLSQKKTTTPVTTTTIPSTGTTASTADADAAAATAALLAAQQAAYQAQLDAYTKALNDAANAAAAKDAAAIIAATGTGSTPSSTTTASDAAKAQAEADAALLAAQTALANQYKSGIASISAQLVTAQQAANDAAAQYQSACNAILPDQNYVKVTMKAHQDIQDILNNWSFFLGYPSNPTGYKQAILDLQSTQASIDKAQTKLMTDLATANSCKTAALNAITSVNLIIERGLAEAGDQRILSIVNAEATRLSQVAQATRTAVALLAQQINSLSQTLVGAGNVTVDSTTPVVATPQPVTITPTPVTTTTPTAPVGASTSTKQYWYKVKFNDNSEETIAVPNDGHSSLWDIVSQSDVKYQTYLGFY